MHSEVRAMQSEVALVHHDKQLSPVLVLFMEFFFQKRNIIFSNGQLCIAQYSYHGESAILLLPTCDLII